jgi:methionyl-tRNA synthetase
MQLQIGEVLSCEEVPNSKKLLCSQVQVSGRVLQIVSGIKNYYSAEDMVGKKVVVITNLAPAKLAGVLSEGMLLCAEDDEGNLSLLTTEKDVPAGSMIS